MIHSVERTLETMFFRSTYAVFLRNDRLFYIHICIHTYFSHLNQPNEEPHLLQSAKHNPYIYYLNNRTKIGYVACDYF